MTWNACAKFGRLADALRMRGLDPANFSLVQLDKVLRRRGITDRELSPIVWTLINHLEPPGCTMGHCKFYGHSSSPMNCADGRVPGRCEIFRDYKARRKARLAKQAARDWRTILNDRGSIKYDEISKGEALRSAEHACSALSRYHPENKDQYLAALEGARAALSNSEHSGPCHPISGAQAK